MSNINQIIKEVNSTMAMEYLPLTENDIKMIKSTGGNHDKIEKLISDLVSKYTIVSSSDE